MQKGVSMNVVYKRFVIAGFMTSCLVTFDAQIFAANASYPSPLSVRLSVPAETVKIGSNIVINVETTNESRKDITIDRSGGCDGCEVSVVRSDGQEPTNLLAGGTSVSSAVLDTLGPGEKINEQVIVNQLFDIKSPGTYVIRVTRFYVLNPDSTIDIQPTVTMSNLIRVTVTK
jgi:hypothetical protein